MNTNESKAITLLQQALELLLENIESPSFPSSNGGGQSIIRTQRLNG